jgi:hypothetical protein
MVLRLYRRAGLGCCIDDSKHFDRDLASCHLTIQNATKLMYLGLYFYKLTSERTCNPVRQALFLD